MNNWRNMKSKSSLGMTIVEMAVVMALSAIVLIGMLVAYTDGITYWRATSGRMLLYNEGTTALSRMTRWMRNSNYIRIRPVHGRKNAKVILGYIDDSWGAEFYYVPSEKSIRWSDQTEGRNLFNMRLLPSIRYRGTRPNEKPYLYVDSLTFTPLDDIGFGSPELVGYSLVRIDLLMESQDEDTLRLSAVVSKRNN